MFTSDVQFVAPPKNFMGNLLELYLDAARSEQPVFPFISPELINKAISSLQKEYIF